MLGKHLAGCTDTTEACWLCKTRALTGTTEILALQGAGPFAIATASDLSTIGNWHFGVLQLLKPRGLHIVLQLLVKEVLEAITTDIFPSLAPRCWIPQ